MDGDFNGKPRKMVLHASRNGYYFTLDRTTGERLVTSKFSDTVNWAKKINAKVTSLPTSHVPMQSRPKEVAAVIIAAAETSK